MGTSTNAELAYGVHLGSENDWLNLDTSDDPYDDESMDTDDLLRAMYEFVPTVANPYDEDGNCGPNHTPELADRWHTERSEFLAGLPVEIHDHCSCEYPMYVLAIKGTHRCASRGDVVDLTDLIKYGAEAHAVRYERWDPILADAVGRLDRIGRLDREPEYGEKFDPTPRWLMFSVWW